MYKLIINTETKTPILLLGYNRPDLLRKRLVELSHMDLPFLYISIDGGSNLSTEFDKVLKEMTPQFPMSCKVEIFRHLENLGLSKHITNSIGKILGLHENIIIVEDDIVMSPSFYKIMNRAVDSFSDNDGIGAIGAFSALLLPRKISNFNRWRRTKYFSCWGWAVSRNVWSKYILDLRGVDLEFELSNSTIWNSLNTTQRSVWMGRFGKIQAHPFTTWDIQFQYMCFKFSLTNIVPIGRIVDNEGFNDSRSAHTKEDKPRWFLSDGFSKSEQIKSRVSILSKIYEKVLDENTVAGDSRFIQWWSHRRHISNVS